MDLKQFGKALEASPGGLHFLNTTIIPSGMDGTWVVEEVNATAVRSWLSGMAHAGEVDFAQSHIGHQATADVASELFGVKLAMDRTPWDGRGVAVALQLRGRLPEGQILSREELESMGYSIRVLYRIAPVPVIENDWNGQDEVDAVALRSLGPRAERASAWTAEALRKDLVKAMGMHGKAELAIETALPGLLSMLWEAHELNLKRIDELRRQIA